MAFLVAGTSASGSLAETTMASTFCATGRVDQLDLTFRGGLRRAGEDDLDVAEFARRLRPAPWWAASKKPLPSVLTTMAIFILSAACALSAKPAAMMAAAVKCLGEFHENLLELSEFAA